MSVQWFSFGNLMAWCVWRCGEHLTQRCPSVERAWMVSHLSCALFYVGVVFYKALDRDGFHPFHLLHISC